MGNDCTVRQVMVEGVRVVPLGALETSARAESLCVQDVAGLVCRCIGHEIPEYQGVRMFWFSPNQIDAARCGIANQHHLSRGGEGLAAH